jgi:hypothetical protein
METPSEWAKRFNQQKTQDEAALPKPEELAAESTASAAEFPSEPFPCPACGQLLAPACRVCVACKSVIDPAQIARTPESVSPAAVTAASAEPRPEPVRYPWRFFFMVLGISFFLALILEAFWGEQTAQLAMGAVQALAGVWVFYDALRQRIRRPLRWAVGTMLLPIVIFPWYLGRRRTPEAPVPFVEAEVGPVTRVLLIAVLLFFLVSLIFYIVQGPQPGSSPTPAPKLQKSGNSSQARMEHLRLPARDTRCG